MAKPGWYIVPEEFPGNTCRRCDVAWYADDEADADERVNIRKRDSQATHIERHDVPMAQEKMTAGFLILARGGRVTYCGVEIKGTVGRTQP